MKATSFLVPVLAAAYASAHGYVSKMTIAGTTYLGNLPNTVGPDVDSIIRRIDTHSPVQDLTDPNLNCGPDAKPAALVADANPGDALTFTWSGGNPEQSWPHNVGPMITYMASCGSTTCDKFNPAQAQWFKISQEGIVNGQWAQASLMTGGVANSQIPTNLAPGNYMIRHEIIALQNAMSVGGAEFYPSCSQVRVGGSGTGAAASSELVSFPGAYSATNPGIKVDVYDLSAGYQFPGPQIAAFVTGSTANETGSGNGGNNSATVSTATPAATTASATLPNTTTAAAASTSTVPANSGKTCRVKSKRAVNVNANSNYSASSVVRPRHISRVMRRLEKGLF